MTEYTTKTLPSGVVITIPVQEHIEIERPKTVEERLAEQDAKIDLLIMMQLEKEGIL